jgi:hypothetical protein
MPAERSPKHQKKLKAIDRRRMSKAHNIKNARWSRTSKKKKEKKEEKKKKLCLKAE